MRKDGVTNADAISAADTATPKVGTQSPTGSFQTLKTVTKEEVTKGPRGVVAAVLIWSAKVREHRPVRHQDEVPQQLPTVAITVPTEAPWKEMPCT